MCTFAGPRDSFLYENAWQVCLSALRRMDPRRAMKVTPRKQSSCHIEEFRGSLGVRVLKFK